MPKSKIIISFIIFLVFLGVTSFVKTQTRIIEKDINKLDRKIAKIKTDLHETQLDYFYLTSPVNLTKQIKSLDLIEYLPMDFSRIYLNFEDFTDNQRKITIFKSDDKKKKEKR